MKGKKLLNIDMLCWLSFTIIVTTGVLEIYSPNGTFLTWGYIVGVLLTVISNNKRAIIISVLLSIFFVGLSFVRMQHDVEFKTAVLTQAYSLVGLGFTGYVVLRFITREAKSRNERMLMAEIFSKGTQGIILAKSTGEIVMANPYAEKIFRLEQSKLIGSAIQSLIPQITFHDNALPNQNASSPAQEIRKDLIAIRSDGVEFPVEITLNQYEAGGEKYVVTFATDITLRKRNEEILLAQKSELEVVNHQLEAFSYSVSHDLRSPLRAVGGYAEMLVEDYGATLDNEANRLLGQIRKNALRMGTLIDDLLTFSRLGRKEVRKSEVDMIQLVYGLLDELKLQANANTKVVVHNLHPVMADASLISHVMSNLLSNAIKYSSKNGGPCIDISSTEGDGSIVYCVRDNGVGFDMVYAEKLFGVFQRLHSDSEFEGTGVGLAIAQRIIQKHGGNIWAVGREGNGAAFYFSLPVQQATPALGGARLNDVLKSNVNATEENYKIV